LQDRLNEVKQKPLPYKPQKIENEWEKLRKSKPEDFDQSPDTSVKQTMIDKVGKALTTIPEGFKPLKQIEKLLKDRKAAFFDDKILGWAEAELLAYGSLLSQGVPVRMLGLFFMVLLAVTVSEAIWRYCPQRRHSLLQRYRSAVSAKCSRRRSSAQ